MGACRRRITVGQALAGAVVLFIALLCSQPSLAGGDDHRTLQLLLNKGIITQEEYDQAVEEEERAKVEEEKRAKQATSSRRTDYRSNWEASPKSISSGTIRKALRKSSAIVRCCIAIR